MATTAFHPAGYPGMAYGSFAGKEETEAPAARITTLWGYGGPGHLYGSFAGKEPDPGGGDVVAVDWIVMARRRGKR